MFYKAKEWLKKMFVKIETVLKNPPTIVGYYTHQKSSYIHVRRSTIPILGLY